MGFGDRVAAQVSARRSQLVLGLDPDPGRLWPRALELAGGAGPSSFEFAGDAGQSLFELAGAAEPPPAARAALAVSIHCTLLIDAVAEQCVAVKPQVACFERLGAPGWAALREVVARARERDLLVIADAKRGDIDVTAAAYAQAFFGATQTPYGDVESLGVDALTVNPLLGADSLEPFVTAARDHGGGLFALVRTSNAGAADIQDRRLAEEGSVSDALAQIVASLGEPGIGSSGLSDIGAVVGATAPERLESLRAQMPAAVFLLPGVGAQGGHVEDLSPAFVPGPGGGLVTVSRAIAAAHERTGGDPEKAAREEAARLRELAWDLVS